MVAQQITNEQVAALFDAHAHRIKAYCQRVLGCPQAAEDATQEAFLNILRRNPKVLNDPQAHRTYIFATARNACMDMLRKRQHPTSSLDAMADAGDPAADPISTRLEHEPHRQAVLAELRGELTGALAQLPATQAAVVVLREAADMSYAQIAEQVGTNANNVAQLLHRGRRNLASTLGQAA